MNVCIVCDTGAWSTISRVCTIPSGLQSSRMQSDLASASSVEVSMNGYVCGSEVPKRKFTPALRIAVSCFINHIT